MKKLFILILPLLLSSCNDFFMEYSQSDLLQEKGIVIAKQYRGEINASGNSVGIDTNGDISFGVVSMHESERFDVVFKCDHGVLFTINKPEMYSKVKEGDHVIISYYEITNSGGNVVRLDFVDANSYSVSK